MKLLDRIRVRTAPEGYLWRTAVVWAAIWLATAVVLQDTGAFARMIPILAVGTGWFLVVIPGRLPDQRGSARHSG